MEVSRTDKKYKDSKKLNKSDIVIALNRATENWFEDKGYWYMYEYEECVLCGHRREIKYRVHDRPKPNDPGKRHKFSQFVCGEHFA